MEWWKSQKAQTSLEVMIALALFLLMTTASFTLLGVTVTENRLSYERQQAQDVLQEGVEAVRQMRDANWTNLTAGTHGLALSGSNWTFSGSQDVQGIFQRVVTVTAIDANTFNVTVTVSWNSSVRGSVSVDASTRFSNWVAVTPPIVSASNCVASSTISGDWSHPYVLGTADIGPGNQGTDIAVALPYVFVSGVAASSSKPDLFVFDVSTPSAPSLVKSIDIGAGGINALSLEGNYLYAASSNDSNELMVFDVTIPASTSKIGSTNLTGSENGLTVLASEDWVALGRAANGAGEIYFYDVSTPSTPSLVGSFEVGGDVNDFATDGDVLYSVNSVSGADLLMTNITDPIHPTALGSYASADGYADISIAYQYPSTLFVGNTNGQLLVLDVTSPPTVSAVSTNSVGGTVQDALCVIDNFIFTGTDNSTKEFLSLDISNLATLLEYAYLNFPQSATGVAFANNMIFLSVRSNDALRIITSTP